MEYTLLILYLITLIVIGFLIHLTINTPTKIPEKRSEIPHASFETHHWGYSWRPWWRKYNGLPGFNTEEDNPYKLPVPSKPLIV